MRLFLSSYRLGDRSAELHPRRGTRAAVILNALDVFGDTRDKGWQVLSGELLDLGWQCDELDLRVYFDCPERLGRAISSFSLLWAVGGNAFVLARAMTAAGLQDAVRRHRHDADFAYGGFSAGACVAGPDLMGLHLTDDPDELPDGYAASVPAHTLGLIDARIVPHWRSPHPEAERAEATRVWMEQRGLSHLCLRDGEAFVDELSPHRER